MLWCTTDCDNMFCVRWLFYLLFTYKHWSLTCFKWLLNTVSAISLTDRGRELLTEGSIWTRRRLTAGGKWPGGVWLGGIWPGFVWHVGGLYIHTPEDIFKLLSRPDSPIIPVFDPQRRYPIPWKTPSVWRKIHGGGKKCDFRLKSPSISETVRKKSMVAM